MPSPLLCGPRAISKALRELFEAHDLQVDDADEPGDLNVRLLIEDIEVMIFAEIERSASRVRLLSFLTIPVTTPAEQCTLVANSLNNRSKFVTVLLPDPGAPFALESRLLLGDGMCLRSQLVALAASHLQALVVLVPLLDSFSRGECTPEELMQRLSLVLALHEQSPAQGRDESSSPARPSFPAHGLN